MFNKEELELLKQFKKKAYTMLSKRREMEDKFGKLNGNVFDGGFYTVMNKDIMSKEEIDEYEDLNNQLDILEDIFV